MMRLEDARGRCDRPRPSFKSNIAGGRCRAGLVRRREAVQRLFRRARAVVPVQRQPAAGVRDFGARSCMCMLRPLVGAAVHRPRRRWRWRGEAAES